MKIKLSFLLIILFFTAESFAQNVGIGIALPETPLHISSPTDTNVLIVESGSLLTSGKSAGLVFKTNTYYTGGIRAFGVNTGAARLGLFSGTSATINGIQERISISNNGNIGIGTVTPASKLDVNGTGYFQNIGGSATPALKGYSDVDSRFAPGVVGSGTSIGVLGNSNTVKGIGLFGYNNLNNEVITYFSGSGVQGFSSAGHGVVGKTTQAGFAGVYGITSNPNAWAAGLFIGDAGAKSLFTIGPIRLSGIGEGAGKVLTSDAEGNATWQTQEKVSFSAYLNTGFAAVADNNYQLGGLKTEFEYGNSFNAADGIFTAPSDGVYQFTTRIGFGTSGTNPIYSAVYFKKNGTDITGGQFNHITIPTTATNWYETLNYTKTIKLAAGENVSVSFILAQSGTSTINISGGNTTGTSFISGVKLH